METSRSRQERARQTRRQISDAGKELFLARGYAAATIADIARAAHVAPQTVYFVFGSKAALLSAILDYETAGDAEPAPPPRAPRAEQIRDPVRRLQRIVALALEVTQRLAPLYEIVRGGAAEPDIAALLARYEDARWRGLYARLTPLEASLSSGLRLEDAADRLYALLSHDLRWLLVRRRGWGDSRWRRYVMDEAVRQLLPPRGR